jgi:hypothetical protein
VNNHRARHAQFVVQRTDLRKSSNVQIFPAALLIVVDHLWRGFARFKLRRHSLDLRDKGCRRQRRFSQTEQRTARG